MTKDAQHDDRVLSAEFRRLSLQGAHVARRAGLLFHWKADGSKSVLRAADVIADRGTASAHAGQGLPGPAAPQLQAQDSRIVQSRPWQQQQHQVPQQVQPMHAVRQPMPQGEAHGARS